MTTPASNPQRNEAARRVRELADELGFALCGIAPAAASDHADFVRQWLADDKHGEMHYLATNLDLRLDPRELLTGARSVIVVADVYPPGVYDSPTDTQQPQPPVGRVARYAWGDDYHKTIKQRLHRLADALRERHPAAVFRATVDTAPLLEREHAARAGLGWIGKHTLTLHPRLGSYLLLGAIVTTLDLADAAEEDYPGHTLPPTDHCGTCTRCIDACPTQCIADPAHHQGHRTLDATRCISYLTLEHRSLIDTSLHASMNDWLAGCDVCQQVCPYNQPIETRPPPAPEIRNVKSDIALPIHPRYTPRAELTLGLNLLDVLNWTADDRQRVFQGSALKRMKLEMVKRNALIAAGNALMQNDDPPLRQRIHELAHDADEHTLVRDTARQIVARLERKKPTA
ncbi:tRNA epoxyqueuosine(34) reductase QueG [Phycisphaerales bacterium AB-hyl4]|uniref:tRNA epoxyqueuosine(34) reductase QueG n=1 Tax=Natronomicrosphaera hydrolytica TaxID=3242702 RepID=A0ABV4U3H1_9BACT